jgi:hypothetical protein
MIAAYVHPAPAANRTRCDYGSVQVRAHKSATPPSPLLFIIAAGYNNRRDSFNPCLGSWLGTVRQEITIEGITHLKGKEGYR